MDWLKISSAIFAFSAFQFFSFCQAPPPVKTPQPPAIESKTGYLTASADIELLPEMPKIFIAPQTTLPVMEDSRENYLVLVIIDSFAACCRIPKYQKYMVMTELSRDGKSIYFRGGIEAELIPFKIFSGEEMPITGEDSKNYFVSVLRRKANMTVKMPKQAENVAFSRESAYAKFAAEQRGKGLEYYGGAWVSGDKVSDLRSSQLSAESEKQRKWDTLKAMAEAGIIVLKDGKIIHGAYKGGDKTSVFFESDGGDTRLYGIEDIGDIEYGKAVALGNLDSAGRLVLKAEKLMDSSPGEAKKYLDQAEPFLKKVVSPLPDIREKSTGIGAVIAEMSGNIEGKLREKGLVLFNYETFPEDVLNYHREKGHMLIGGKTWINPEQLCRRCSGGGEISCIKCQGAGKINRKCEKCQNGRMACRICDGKGYRPCNFCNGVGELLRTCARCGGSGVVSGYYSYPSGPSLYLSSGAIVVGGFSPWCYSNFITRACSVCGGSGNMSIACSSCGGTGNLICSKTEKCSFCNGAGFLKTACSDCDGKGRLICPACFGKGYKGEAQKYPGQEGVPDSGAGGISRGAKSQTLLP
ncbi:MAG: hypothetical protein WC637_16475 [Victivallales bacterium]